MEGCCKHEQDGKKDKINYLLTIMGIIIFVTGILWRSYTAISVVLYILSYLLIGYDIFLNAIKKLFRKDMFDENFLMTIATVGALATKNYIEGIAVLLLYKIGEFLQDKAVENSKRKIEKAINIKAEYANIYKDNAITKVNPIEVKIGDTILVKNGEKVPLDGIVTEGNTSIDTSALTGESIPREIKEGDRILSGSINVSNAIKVKVTKDYQGSTVYKIIELIQNAVEKKSNTEKFITKFSKVYTPIVTMLALLIAIIFPLLLNIPVEESIFRALTFLVVSCPCALVISVPLGFFVGIGSCSKRGILVKGSNYLDILSTIDTILFDKTGTLTYGTFKVVKEELKSDRISKEKIIECIVLAESLSNHYIAKSIVNYYHIDIDKSKMTEHKEIAGKGIIATIDGNIVLVGNETLLSAEKISYHKVNEIGTVLHVVINKEHIGYIVLNDMIKEGSYSLIKGLKRLGIKETILVTGDRKNVAENVVYELAIDEVYSELLPKDKANIVEKIKSNKKIAYVGDGINDGPVIAIADVGIAMGAGSDIAIETADIVLMDDKPEKMITAIKIARKTKFVVTQNIIAILLVKIVFLILSAFGISTMWEAIFADVGMSLLTILNCMRIYKIRKK
ncbi:MAG: heavy metal translocating P-type ATPase [Clostridia bacterium]|nr:heavy metal translocating P-type ATPase [Clostridia bacterium]